MKNIFYLFKNICVIFFLMMFISACTPGNGASPSPSVESKFLYANLNKSTNYVAAYSIGSDGTLTEISGSPFATGGTSSSGYFGAKAIAIARNKKLLFASNKNDNTISVFSIDSSTGALTAIGSPVSGGGTMAGSGSLAVDANENFLFVSNGSGSSISVFSIATNGTLTAVSGSPFSLSEDNNIDGIALNTSGNILYVAQPEGGNTIAVMSVASDGTLTEISGSPFDYTGSGQVASFAFVSDSLAVSGAYNYGNDVTSYSVASDGTPTVADSLSLTNNNQCISLSPSGKFAVAAGGSAPQVSVISVASDGTLTAVSGSSFSTSYNTSGYAIVSSGDKYVYVTEDSHIEAFSMDSSGALTSLGAYVTSSSRIDALAIY